MLGEDVIKFLLELREAKLTPHLIPHPQLKNALGTSLIFVDEWDLGSRLYLLFPQLHI